MYIPRAFRNDNLDELVAFMQAHGFITLVSIREGAPFASHVPVAVRREGDVVTLHGHVARANPHWQAFGGSDTLAIFSGPHAYISPSHYERHENVPTWNYIAVHAWGPVRALHAADDAGGLEQEVRTLIRAYDEAYEAHWESLSKRYREGMLQGVVGFTLMVTRLEGKYKLSQNRSVVDQHTVATALLSSDDAVTRATGEAMCQGLEKAEVEKRPSA
jgi:transcriptional regulator